MSANDYEGGVLAGAGANKYTRFIHAQVRKGYSRKQANVMYRKKYGTVKQRAKKAKTIKRKVIYVRKSAPKRKSVAKRKAPMKRRAPAKPRKARKPRKVTEYQIYLQSPEAMDLMARGVPRKDIREGFLRSRGKGRFVGPLMEYLPPVPPGLPAGMTRADYAAL